MSEIRALIEQLVMAGVDPIEAAEVVARAAIHGAATAPKSKTAGAIRQERYRRNKASQVTEGDAGDDLLSPEGSSPTPPSPKPLSSIPPSPPKGGSSPTDRAIEAFSKHAERAGLPVPRKVTADRRRKIEARLREHGEDAWSEACRRMADSAFCRGENDRGWRADLDFLCQPKSFNGLIEGKYDDRPSPRSTAPPREPRTVAERAIQRLQTGQTDYEPPDEPNRPLVQSFGSGQTQGPGVLELVALAANGYRRS